jgi:hypothetical protein
MARLGSNLGELGLLGGLVKRREIGKRWGAIEGCELEGTGSSLVQKTLLRP